MNGIAVRIADVLAVAGRDEMRHVERNQRRALGPLQRPKRIMLALPIGQPGDEIRLRRPDHAVVHGFVIAQPLQQHVVEAGRTNDVTDRNAGKTVEQLAAPCCPAATQQEVRVLLKTFDEVVDVIAEPGIAAVDMRQIGAGLGGLVRFRRPHRVGIDFVPSDFRFGGPVRGHAADGKDDVVGRAPISGKQAHRRDGIADDFGRRGESEIFRSFGAALFGTGLQNHFQIDRHRMIAAGDHVLLMHVGCGKAVKQRQPAAGTPEKPRETLRIGARRVIDEFGPAVAVQRDRAHGFELERGLSAVQALDQGVPGGIKPQILRLVDDPRAVLEADDADRAAVIVRIGEIAFESGNAAGIAGTENIAADRRKIGIETQHHFARGVDPLPRHGREQPQQHRLVFEQAAPTAGFHVSNKAIVARRAVRLRRTRRIVLRRTGIARLGEALVERRHAQIGELAKQRQAQRRARGFVQVVADPRIEARPKPRVGLFDQ